MYNTLEGEPDPLDEFLAQLMKDFPDVLLEPTTVPPPRPASFLPPLTIPLPPPPSWSPPSPSSLCSSPSPSPSWPPPTPSSLWSPPSPTSLWPQTSPPSLYSPPSPTPPLPYSLDHPQYWTPEAPSTCQWRSSDNYSLICGAPLSQDRKLVCSHFRNFHDVRGNEKVLISCNWNGCRVTPMQRGSLIRHVLTVHLGLTKWCCERCGKTFSRKGTAHLCVKDG